jgi:hypothetical protein
MDKYFFKDISKKPTVHLVILAVSILTLISVLVLIYLLFDKRTRQAETQACASATVAQTPDTGGQANELQPNIQSADPAVVDLVKKVFRHILLPDGDVQIQKVVKPDELRKANPVFYQYVREGDQILIYPDRAILYDPLIDKVLDVIHTPTQ